MFLKKLRRFVDEHYPGTLLLAEANQWPEDLLPYFGNGDEFHMAFNFPLMPRMFMAIRREQSLADHRNHGPAPGHSQRAASGPCFFAITMN